MANKQQIPVHQSLIRPVLVAGAERELVYATWAMAAALVFGAGVTWVTVSLSLILAAIANVGLAKLAKRDPFMRQVYLRHISYQEFYPSQPHALSRTLKVFSSIGASKWAGVIQ